MRAPSIRSVSVTLALGWLLHAATAADAQAPAEREAPSRPAPAADAPTSPGPVQPADGGAAAAPAPDAVRKRIKVLIENLGSSFEPVRQRAERELVEKGIPAIPALREAAASPKPGVADRARRALDEILASAFGAADALGAPIPDARVRLDVRGRGEVTVVMSPEGYAVLPAPAAEIEGCTVEHPLYGQARARVEVANGKCSVRAPLVRQGTEAAERALRGIVVDPSGSAVPSARVRVESVRTLGEGLINSVPDVIALTDEAGRFSVYPIAEDRKEERGDLVPPGSRYSIIVEGPAGAGSELPDGGLFPHAGEHVAAEEARIRLEKPERMHALKFEGPDGGLISDPQMLRRIFLSYRPGPRGPRAPLGSKPAEAGRCRLIPGRYEASLDGIEYEAVELAADSPEEITFRLPPPVSFRGRVVDGAGGDPIRGAFLMGWSSTGKANLAALTRAQWAQLHALPRTVGVDHPDVAPLAEHYGIIAIMKTDGEGRFEIAQPRGPKFYGLMAFDEDRIPFKVLAHGITVGPDGRADVGDIPLFPAAKLTVRPVAPVQGLSVSPKWILAKDGQPAWIDRLRASTAGGAREVEYVHWLALGDAQPLFVPAAVRLDVRLESPYADEWSPAMAAKDLLLGVGEVKDAGDISFPASLPMQVQVVDAAGRPLEGIPVRRKHDAEDGWCVAHNTDAGGISRFWVHPRSRGSFRVLHHDAPDGSGMPDAPNLAVAFEAGDEKPVAGAAPAPLRIVLTDSQVEVFLGKRKAK